MHAGRGIVHSERPPHDIIEHGGVQEIVQLWINTPAGHKMDQPSYYALPADKTPTITAGGVTTQVVAGSFGGIKGPVATFSPMLVLRLQAEAGATCSIPVPEGYTCFLYLLNGAVQVQGFGMVEGMHQIIFNNDGEGIQFTAKEPVRALLLAGQPIGEAVAVNGPFVMNTETELLQVMRDYRMGKLGILIED